MSIRSFEQWLQQYGDAWRAGDPEAVVRLFCDEAEYYEVPFAPPMVGLEAIRRYWTEGAKNGQSGVAFAAQPIAFDGSTGYARWQASFTRVSSGARVELDGVLQAQFDAAMKCGTFREWWHRRER